MEVMFVTFRPARKPSIDVRKPSKPKQDSMCPIDRPKRKAFAVKFKPRCKEAWKRRWLPKKGETRPKVAVVPSASEVPHLRRPTVYVRQPTKDVLLCLIRNPAR